VRQPARVALAMLHAYGLPWDDDLAPVQAFDAEQRRLLRTVLTRGVGTVSCTSMGRLFDVCAALLGVQQAVSYEGQAAVEFTALAMRGRSLGAHVRTDGTVRDVDGRLELDPAPMLAALVDGMRRGVPRDALAYAVHAALADAVATVAEQLATREHVRTVGLTGGVFQNRLLLALCREQLQTRGLAVRTHAMVPCNDGGLALGQAVIARHADLSQRPTVTP
jgi:hydrogenase maturation protein HypF